MYKENIRIKTYDEGEIIVNAESVAYRSSGYNYYFNCNQCKNFIPGDDTGTQYDCNNCAEIESIEQTKKGRCKLYCVNYCKNVNKENN